MLKAVLSTKKDGEEDGKSSEHGGPRRDAFCVVVYTGMESVLPTI